MASFKETSPFILSTYFLHFILFNFFTLFCYFILLFYFSIHFCIFFDIGSIFYDSDTKLTFFYSFRNKGKFLTVSLCFFDKDVK